MFQNSTGNLFNFGYGTLQYGESKLVVLRRLTTVAISMNGIGETS